MLKILRREAIEKPWVLGILFGGLAILFIFGMGWWGFDQGKQDLVAKVGSKSLTITEYQRVYQTTLNQYRSAFGDRFNSEMEQQLNIRKISLDQAINRLLWLQYARSLGLSISSDEVEKAVVTMIVFRQAGRFDREMYRRILAANRLTPEQFEESLREDLLVDRAQDLVRQAVALTPEEVALAGTLAGRQVKSSRSPGEELSRQLASRLLAQKQEMALESFTRQLRNRYKVTIKPEYLS